MKKIFGLIIGLLFVASLAQAAQINLLTQTDTFGASWTNQNTMNTELYVGLADLETWKATLDTEGELKSLYNLEDADISTLATVVVTSMLGAAHDSEAELAALLGGKVGTEGAETIAGVKTFASAPLFEVGFDVSPSVDPTMELKDSDAPGTDKESAKIVSNYIDGAVGAENHDLMFYVKQGGAYVLGLLLNESEDRWEFLKNTTFQAGDIQYEELAPSARGVETTGSFAAPITANPYSLTTALSYDAVLFYGAAGEVDLAAGVDGMSVVVYNAGADTVTIDPDGTEMVTRDGIVQPAGVSITLSSGAGNFVALVFDGTQWVTMGYKGTLAEGS